MFEANASCSGQSECHVNGTITEFGRDGVPSARGAGDPVPVGVVDKCFRSLWWSGWVRTQVYSPHFGAIDAVMVESAVGVCGLRIGTESLGHAGVTG
jgi:hypothetical protein